MRKNNLTKKSRDITIVSIGEDDSASEVITFSYAYVPGEIDLCERHAETEPHLGPVQHGLHAGTCERCEPEERWTYEGYWNAVLGAHRDSKRVIEEVRLDPADRAGLDQWLGQAEAEAWRVGGERGPTPPEWADHHARALAELSQAGGDQ